MEQHAVRKMSRDECLSLISRQSVGRLVFVDEDGPAALPVNFVLDEGGRLVFRLEGGSMWRALGDRVAFEVDAADDQSSSGWSVLVRGAPERIATDDVPALLHALHERFPRPWAGGVHNHWVVLTPEIVTGRRLEGLYSPPVI